LFPPKSKNFSHRASPLTHPLYPHQSRPPITPRFPVCFDPRPPGHRQGAGGGQPQCAAAGGPGSRRGPRGWPRPLPCAWARQRRSSLRRGWVGGGVCRGLPDAILADAAPLTVWRVASQRPGELPRRPVPRTLSSARLWSHPFH
jgi:hypothetical protein